VEGTILMAIHGFMYRTTLVGAAVAALLVGATSVGAQAEPAGAGPSAAASGDRGASYWTPARRAAAQPRDLVIDQRGLGYLKRADGALEPYGHSVAAAPISVRAVAPAGSTKPQAGPPSGGDGKAPLIEGADPAGGTIGAEYPFRATVTDGDGVKSVNFVLTKGSSSTSYSASRIGTNLYGIDFINFTDGDWSWTIVARDNAKGGGTTSTSQPIAFTVDTGGGAPPPTTEPPPTTQPPLAGSCDNTTTSIVVNDRWTCGGKVQTAAGRIYFEMPANRRATRWSGYVCSGTVVDDGATGTSVILTAAHCVYDDVNKAFARNVLFIPNQAGTTGAGTDRDCSNDPLGCWSPTYGVVDVDWTTRKFPDNIPYDYAYYVVPDAGAHTGNGTSGALDGTVGALPVNFLASAPGNRAHALGYSYSDDPHFMYCAENLGRESSYNDYWLGSCGLSGGASGGPWIQTMDEKAGSGPIISVNSWGYTTAPGMGGPPLTTSAKCVFDARTNSLNNPRGVIVTC